MRQVSNPPNPWESTHVEWLGEAPDARLQIYEQTATEILSHNNSPDLGFDWSLNPYRGCFHACAYCYARPRHQLLGWGAGTDFERRIVVKTNAAAALRRKLMKPSWRGDLIMFSGDTDCYQPLEATYGLTRACLEVCQEFRQPIGMITKGALVARDADVLARLADVAHVRVILTIPFADSSVAKKLEPGVCSIDQRFAVMRRLADAGVPTGIMIGPMIPGLSESYIPELLERAAESGATSASMILLRLPGEVKQVFWSRLAEAFPEERVERIRRALHDLRDGKDYDPRFGARGRGVGPRWRATRQLFDLHRRRLGLDAPSPEIADTFRRPTPQLSLFGA